MCFSIRNLFKPILGIFLFGLALWFSPIEASAYSNFGVTDYIPNGTTLPYSYNGFFPSELGTLTPSSFVYGGVYNNLPLDLPFSPAVSVDNTYTFDFNFSLSFFNTFYNVECSGPLLLQYTLTYENSAGFANVLIGSSFHDLNLSADTPFFSINDTFIVTCPGAPRSYSVSISNLYNNYAYVPWVFNVSPSYSGSALPNSSGSSNTFTLTGYSDPVDSSRILMTDQSSGHVYDGKIFTRMCDITLTGSVPFNNPDYDISFSEDDVDPSGSRFIFAIYSSVSNFRLDYEKSIADNTETIKNQFEEYFDYNPPNTQSFNSDKSSVDSSINTVTTFQNTAFSGLSSAVNDTGLDNFDFAEYGPQMSYVGLLLTSIYNVFPNKFRYVIYFVLFVGFFGVLLNAGHYIKKMRDSE